MRNSFALLSCIFIWSIIPECYTMEADRGTEGNQLPAPLRQLPIELMQNIIHPLEIGNILNFSEINKESYRYFSKHENALFFFLAERDFPCESDFDYSSPRSWREKYKKFYIDDLNAERTFRFSYFCPIMTVSHKLSYMEIRLSDGQILRTKSWGGYVPDGTRYPFFKMPLPQSEIIQPINSNKISKLTLAKINCPFEIKVYFATGHIEISGNNVTNIYWPPISLHIEKHHLSKDLQAIRVTHSPKCVRELYFQLKKG